MYVETLRARLSGLLMLSLSKLLFLGFNATRSAESLPVSILGKADAIGGSRSSSFIFTLESFCRSFFSELGANLCALV